MGRARRHRRRRPRPLPRRSRCVARTSAARQPHLSGGQWQRLALARLHVRNAALWILDEPTASLDPVAEARTFETLRQHLAGRSALLISHRFSTVRTADRIILERGHVTADGSHSEPVAADGTYARLFETQAAGYG